MPLEEVIERLAAAKNNLERAEIVTALVAYWQRRAEQAEADAAALAQAILEYVTSATEDDRTRLRGRLYDMAMVDHPGATLLAELLAELKAAQEIVEAVRGDVDVSQWLDEEIDAYDAAVKARTDRKDTRHERDDNHH